MDSSEDLRLLLASRHTLIVAEMHDEERFMGILRRAAQIAGYPVWTWSVTHGLARDGQATQLATADPRRALDFIGSVPGAGVFVLHDIHPSLADAAVLRRIKEIGQQAKPGQTLVLTGPNESIPPELEGLALPWTLQPPTREELEALVRRMVNDLMARGFAVGLDAGGVAQMVEAVRGLTVPEAERLIMRATIRDGRLDDTDVAEVRGAKAELLEAGGVIELVATDAGTLDAVGGLVHLKEWLRTRGRAFEPAAQTFGLEPPRGVLLTGVPGCGKSLVAKTLARTWGMPLVLLDPSRLYGPYVGESEGRLRDSLMTVEAMAPVVLWIDEIEKGFAGDSVGDSGVSRRILGSFLRWMQDRPPGLFIVATCNDVASMPPEFLRKGRFDEIFFIDLPPATDREAIIRIQLARRKRDPASFDVPALAGVAEGLSGAEIEACVVGALYRAYAAGREITTEDVVAEISATTPLSRTRDEEIQRLRAWAAGRTVPAA